jgi:hypothetical protein
MEMTVAEGMRRPCGEPDAILWHDASWGDRISPRFRSIANVAVQSRMWRRRKRWPLDSTFRSTLMGRMGTAISPRGDSRSIASN